MGETGVIQPVQISMASSEGGSDGASAVNSELEGQDKRGFLSGPAGAGQPASVGGDRAHVRPARESAKMPVQVALADDRAVASTSRAVSGNSPAASKLRKGGGYYKVGKPYQIAGITYVPHEDPDYEATGEASWYGEDFHGKPTANGEVFDMDALSAAHRTLPLPSYAYVTNLENGRTVMVRINNRGPFAKGRLIDVSARVARELGFAHKGVAQVKVTYAGPAPLNGRDDREEAHLAQSRSGG